MKKLEFDKTLVCSTTHFTDDDNVALAKFAKEHAHAPDTSEHFIADLGYGYIVWVNSDGAFTEYDGVLSDAFVKVLEFAHRQGAQWVRFDRDALEIEGLQTFEW